MSSQRSTAQGGPNVVRNGLVLYLDAANRRSYVSGSTNWNDLTMNGNNGTLVNGPTFNSANGGSIVFDGADDTVEIGNPPSLYITTSLTLMSCIYVTNTITFGTIMGKWGSTLINNKVYKSSVLQTTNHFYLDVSDNGAGDIYRISSQPLQTNTWYCTTGVYTSGLTPSIDIYIDGQLSNGTLFGTIPSVLNTTSTANITLGNDNAGGSNRFSGRIGTALVYNRALSAQEVLQNYNALKSRYNL